MKINWINISIIQYNIINCNIITVQFNKFIYTKYYKIKHGSWSPFMWYTIFEIEKKFNPMKWKKTGSRHLKKNKATFVF